MEAAGSHKRRWISQECLDLFITLESVINLFRQSQDLLATIDDRMGYGYSSWVTNLWTYAGNIADTFQEVRMPSFLCDVKHFRTVDATTVEHLLG